jgi:hypothetical protein
MAVGEEGTYLTSLTFDSYSVNTGGGYKASFVFEGFDGDMTGCFTASSTWPVNASSTTGPKCKVLDENSAVVAGLTGKTITSDTVAPSQYQGTLDIYPLSAGSYTIEYYDDTSTLVGSESFVVANTNPKMKDLASGVLVNSVSASATSLVVNVGSGTDAEIKSVWPDTPFYITAMPANPSAGVPNSLDSEIMKVSDVSVDGNGNTTLNVARAQRGSTAQAFSAGAVITNASYADDAVVWGEETSPENPSPWVGTDEIEEGAITGNKIADGAITSAKVAADGYRHPKPSGLTDANNLTDTGLYYLTDIWQNAPDPGSQIYQAIVIMAYGYGHQIFINLWDNNTYIRKCENGTWGSWQRFTLS